MRLQTFVFVIAATHRLNEVYTAERERESRAITVKRVLSVYIQTEYYFITVMSFQSHMFFFLFFFLFLGNTKTGYFKNPGTTLFRTMAVHKDHVCSQQNLLTLISNLYTFPFSAEQNVRYFDCWGHRKKKKLFVCVKSNTLALYTQSLKPVEKDHHSWSSTFVLFLTSLTTLTRKTSLMKIKIIMLFDQLHQLSFAGD